MAAPPAAGLGGRIGRNGRVEPDVVEDLAHGGAGYPRRPDRHRVRGMPMDLAPSERAAALRDDLLAFMDSHVYPAEPVYERQIEEGGDPHRLPPVVEELKAEARKRGLWNLFLPDERWGAGLSNLDYAHLAEITGRSPHIAPEALNGGAPDTGNMEVLACSAPPSSRSAGSCRCSRARSAPASR